MDKSVLKFQAKLAGKVMFVAMFISVVSFFLSSEPKKFILGLFLGTLVSILNFRQMGITMEKAVHMSPTAAQKYAGLQYFIRFLTVGAVLFLSMCSVYVNFIGVALGFLLLKFVILGTNILNMLLKKHF